LDDDNLQVRIAAAWALGDIWHLEESELPDDLIPALIRVLEDRESWVRQTAAWSLGKLWGEVGVIPALTQAIGDPNLSVQETAIRAIPSYRLHNMRLDDSVAAELSLALSQALEDEALSECHNSVLMDLEALGPQAMKAVPALINHLQILQGKGLDNTDAEYKQTRDTLIEITGQRFEDAAAWQAWCEHQQ
jgi:HEAT repeat protein